MRRGLVPPPALLRATPKTPLKTPPQTPPKTLTPPAAFDPARRQRVHGAGTNLRSIRWKVAAVSASASSRQQQLGEQRDRLRLLLDSQRQQARSQQLHAGLARETAACLIGSFAHTLTINRSAEPVRFLSGRTHRPSIQCAFRSIFRTPPTFDAAPPQEKGSGRAEIGTAPSGLFRAVVTLKEDPSTKGPFGARSGSTSRVRSGSTQVTQGRASRGARSSAMREPLHSLPARAPRRFAPLLRWKCHPRVASTKQRSSSGRHRHT